MLTLSSPDFTEIELASGYQITCNSCTDTLFIQRKHRSVITSITEGLSRSGWQKAVNDTEYFVCVCPKCVKELQENEQQLHRYVVYSAQAPQRDHQHHRRPKPLRLAKGS